MMSNTWAAMAEAGILQIPIRAVSPRRFPSQYWGQDIAELGLLVGCDRPTAMSKSVNQI
jgi:hypothetical protein